MMHRTTTRRALTTLAALVGLVVSLAVPAAATQRAAAATPQHWRVLVGAQTANGAIQTMHFYPAHLWVDQGDTVTWVANSKEIHTVTFLSTDSPCPSGALCAPAPFNPGDPRMSTPQGSSSYDGHSYYNSGVLTTARQGAAPLPPFVHVRHRYSLTFPKTTAPGTYNYLCLVHGQLMRGKIIVQAAGTPYPYTQQQYNQRARTRMAADFADGSQLWRATRRKAAALTRKDGTTVLIGAMDNRVMLMRFVPRSVTVRVGRRVHFLANAMAPHTVTFGSDVTGCGTPPCDPSQSWNTVKTSDGNERATYPGRNGGFTGSPTDLSSGIMFGAPPSVTGAPQELTLRLSKRGSYSYMCALHDYMGMRGTVAAAAAGARAPR